MTSLSHGEPRPNTEYRQNPPGPWWSEYHRMVAIDDDDNTAVAVTVGVHAQVGHDMASFHCAIFRFSILPTVIAESEIVAPSRLWELRTFGLWADMICEIPYLHWSYGLEAFGLEVDDSVEMLDRGYGHRVPLGWELEFESSVEHIEQLTYSENLKASEPAGAFSQVGRVHGVLLLAAGAQQRFDGRALRQHWWGQNTTAPMQLLDARFDLLDRPGNEAEVVTEVALPMVEAAGQWWIGRSDGGLRSRTVRA